MSIKQAELEVMVCDLFVDAYRAGQSCGDLAYNAARGTRANLINKIRDVYAELEHESYQREQFEVELMKANNELANLRDQVRSQQETIRKLTLTDPDNTDSPLWSDYAPTEDDIPDDAVKFSEQDLPFPDVEDLAPASELLGGDE